MKYKERFGYSLMEAMIVVAIMGIVASMAVPKFGNYIQQQRLHQDARTIAMELRVARMKAITEKIDYGVKFLPLDQEIVVIKDPLDEAIVVKGPIKLMEANHFSIANIDQNLGIVYTPRGNVRPEALIDPYDNTGRITIWNVKYLPEKREYLSVLSTTGVVKWWRDL